MKSTNKTNKTKHALCGLLSGLLLLAAGTRTLQAAVIAPAGLNPGDQFRIMFLTSGTRNATSSDISVYDAFVTAAALAGGLTTYGGNPVAWQVFGATPTVSGISRIPLSSPAFYRVDGTLIATSGSDLWDGGIAVPINRTETGAIVAIAQVWSGINNVDGSPFNARALGGTDVNGTANSDNLNALSLGHWFTGGLQNRNNLYPFYGVSEVLTVPRAHLRPAAARLRSDAPAAPPPRGGLNSRLGVPQGAATFLSPTCPPRSAICGSAAAALRATGMSPLLGRGPTF